MNSLSELKTLTMAPLTGVPSIFFIAPEKIQGCNCQAAFSLPLCSIILFMFAKVHFFVSSLVRCMCLPVNSFYLHHSPFERPSPALVSQPILQLLRATQYMQTLLAK